MMSDLGRLAIAATVWWVGAGEIGHVYDPSPSEQERRYLNDHTLIRSADGTWHMFGIIGDAAPPGEFPNGAAEIHFAHASAPSLSGPWTTHPYALSLDRNYFGEDHLWAPHVIENGGTYYMFYAAGGNGSAINLATSTDLFNWTRIPSGPLFRGLVARDPFVTRIGNQWVMYYTELADWHSSHTVAYRTSSDLLHWSAPTTVFTDPSTEDISASVTESPFVVERDGFWYFFIGPRNGYVGTDVYRSQDPFHFSAADYAGHVPLHAAEILRDGDAWWFSGAGSFQRGLYLAPLHWQSYAPPWQSPHNPAIALDDQGKLELFALDPRTRAILRRVQTDVGRNLWSDWETFSDPVGAVPTVGVNDDGRLELFALGPNGLNLTHRVQNLDGTWGAWQAFGGAAGAAPAVSRNLDGRLEVFALGPGGQYIAHRWQNRANAAPEDWSDWANFGGPAGAPPAVGINADGRMEVFALGPGGAYIANRWQNAPSGGFGDWASFGGPAGMAPTVARDLRGHLDVFALALVGVGVNMRQQARPNGNWLNWEGFGSWSDAPPAIARNQDGRLEAFLIPPGGARITHRWQNSDGSWHAPEVFGPGPASVTPSVGLDATGRIHVFSVAPDGTVRERVQAAPSGGWNEWHIFGPRPIAVVPAGSPT